MGLHWSSIVSILHVYRVLCFSYDDYWIAGTDGESEGTFKFPDGTTMTYLDWDGGQPNDDHNPQQDCLVGIVKDNHQWHDRPCSQTHYFVCEVPAPGERVTILAPFQKLYYLLAQ